MLIWNIYIKVLTLLRTNFELWSFTTSVLRSSDWPGTNRVTFARAVQSFLPSEMFRFYFMGKSGLGKGGAKSQRVLTENFYLHNIT